MALSNSNHSNPNHSGPNHSGHSPTKNSKEATSLSEALISRRKALLGILSSIATLPLLTPDLANATFTQGTDTSVEQPLESVNGEFEPTGYIDPIFEHLLTQEELESLPFCTARRHDDPRNGGINHHGTAKVFVDESGEISVQTLEHLKDRGWLKKNHSERLLTPPPLPPSANQEHSKPDANNPDTDAAPSRYVHPDIVPSLGSCSKIGFTYSGGVFECYVSNDHVIYSGRRDIEKESHSDPFSDINLLSTHFVKRPYADPHQLRPLFLAPRKITNQNLVEQTVQIIGVASDLFEFEGKPFVLPAEVTLGDGSKRQQNFFGLKVPNDFLARPMEIAGMSGSPVTLKGSREMVGVISRILFYQEKTPPGAPAKYCTILVFAGPDELQKLVRGSAKKLLRQHMDHKNSNAYVKN